MKEPPLLSVCLITYNHAKYIRQAIESVLMQRVSFTWELIIADDCSTDGTREIVLEYYNRYPDFIRLILQDRNVGPAKNWLDLITKPRSKYIAYLEGDDYWTDPLKLQKQVDFLERNPSFSISIHKGKFLKNDLFFTEYIKAPDKSDLNIYDLIERNFIISSTVVFRKINLDFHYLKNNIMLCDYTLWLLLAHHGLIKFLPEEMSVYRIGSGSWSSLHRVSRKIRKVKIYESILCCVLFNKYIKVVSEKFFLEYKKLPFLQKLLLGRLFLKHFLKKIK